VFAHARQGSRVLELGCGSGDVSMWASEAGRRLEIIASDVHNDPDVVPLRPGMAFLGGARAEALPLPTGAVDMVVSNFAFEYSPARVQAACELVRVLRLGGGAVLVMHSHDSDITAISRNHLETCHRLEAADIPGRLRRAAALRADHLSRRKLLKDVLKRKGQVAGGEPCFTLAERLWRGDPKARQDLETLEKDVQAATEIAEAQTNAALDQAALAWLEHQFAGLGVDVFTSEITGTYGLADRRKFAWLLCLNKPWLASGHGGAY
jgi:SAM-dependent methyltransferase